MFDRWLLPICVICVVSALIAPFWIGPIPPLTDFGGHLMLADGWVNLDDNPLLAQYLSRREGVFTNSLATRFVDLVHPALDTLVALRLFVSLCFVALTGVMLWFLKVFNRPSWRIFLCLPLLWGSCLAIGLINYFAALPLMFLAIGLARRTGQQGRIGHGIALSLTFVVAFFAHAIGFVFTVTLACLMLVLSLSRIRHIVFLLVSPLPALALFYKWVSSSGSLEGQASSTLEFDSIEVVRRLINESHDIMRQTSEDTDHFLIVMIIWLVLFHMRGVANGRASPEEQAVGKRSGWLAKLRTFAIQIIREIQKVPLLMMILAVFAMLVFLPGSVSGVGVSWRLVTPFFLLLMMLPKAAPPGIIVNASRIGAVFVGISFGFLLMGQSKDFSEQVTEPMVSLIEQIPERQVVECLGVRHYNRMAFWTPVDHACPGLVQYLTGSFAGTRFAQDSFNVLETESNSYQVLDATQWWNSVHVRNWDYLLVMGSHPQVSLDLLTLVGREEPAGEFAELWTLYRVVGGAHTQQYDVDLFGGPGGSFSSWTCPDGHAVIGLTTYADSLVNGLRAECAPIIDGPVLTFSGRSTSSPYVGDGRTNERQLVCPEDLSVIGIFGRAARYLDQIGLMCARLDRIDDDGVVYRTSSDVVRSDTAGGGGGQTFEVSCPDGEVVNGLVARVGACVDAIGIQCQTPAAPPDLTVDSEE